MVRITEDACIEVISELNDWIHCIFIVGKEDAERAREILDNSFVEYFENDVDDCVGDWLEDNLRNEDIQYEVFWM